MLNKETLKNKYKDLVLENKEKFLEETKFIYSKLNLKALSEAPLLIYSQNKRNALYYILSINYSLKRERILDYAVITGQTLINQHFMKDENRDNQLYQNVLYSDITFLSLSQYDYTNEYLESQIIDLIEFRKMNKKLTIISYDIMNSGQNYIHLTKKLHAYFLSSQFQIVDLTGNKNSFDKPEVGSATPAKRKRIL